MQGLTNDGFSMPIAIGFGRINKIDAELFTLMDQGDGFLIFGARPAKGGSIGLRHHTTKGHGAEADF